MKEIENFKKCTSHHSGITLVALVVTIVVLLILAGITINFILGQNSIFELAKRAGEETNKAVEKEQGDLENLVNYINEQIGGSSTGGNGGNEEEKPPKPDNKPLVGTVTSTDHTENIEAEDKNGNPITIPAGYKVLANGEDKVEYNTDAENHTPCVEDGIVIQDSVGNQFVWVPVNEGQYAKMIDETDEKNKRGNLYTFSTTGTTPITYSATRYREPDTVNDSGTNNRYDNLSTNFTSAGIYNETEGDVTNATTFKALLQKEFDSMAASVKKYKGFYIGRYETGNLEAVKNSTPVVQRGNSKISNVNWYYMYANSKNIAKNNDKVTSSMIWGCQWDRTIEWIVATNDNDWSLATDSRSWGNYSNSTGDATTNSGSKQSTGKNEAWKKNNIYDMAGNVYDWTLEVYLTNGRIFRGGNYIDSGSGLPVSFRSYTDPTNSSSVYGSRLVLYVK